MIFILHFSVLYMMTKLYCFLPRLSSHPIADLSSFLCPSPAKHSSTRISPLCQYFTLFLHTSSSREEIIGKNFSHTCKSTLLPLGIFLLSFSATCKKIPRHRRGIFSCFPVYFSLSIPILTRRMTSSRPRIWHSSTAPPGVTALPAMAMRRGHMRVAFLTSNCSARAMSAS